MSSPLPVRVDQPHGVVVLTALGQLLGFLLGGEDRPRERVIGVTRLNPHPDLPQRHLVAIEVTEIGAVTPEGALDGVLVLNEDSDEGNQFPVSVKPRDAEIFFANSWVASSSGFSLKNASTWPAGT